MVTEINKVVCIGEQPDVGKLFAKITFKHGNLSITGVEGPLNNGNALGSSGQIIMNDWKFKSYYPGWNAKLVEKFREIWKKWHLNYLIAGSPAQEAWIAANPLEYKYPETYYTVYQKALTEAGLNPDASYIYAGKPYRYGSAWLKKEVPADVLEFLNNLPDAVVKPAWV